MELREFAAYEPSVLEKEVLDFWESKGIPQALSAHRRGAKKFFLLDGPPYINALPHVGHVKTTTCKDVWTRLKYMQGFDCLIQPGFDCHGLPVEVIVEKELGIEKKSQIAEMGVDKFMKTCLEKVLNNEKAWLAYYKQLGAWRAFFEPYFTYKNYYIESAWWTFKTLYEKGFVVQGTRPIHWCSHCETALSGYEVSDSYKDVSDPSIYVKFKVKGSKNEYLLAWTTTPWTLPSNAALAVVPKEKYVKAKTQGANGEEEIIIVAEKLVQKVFEKAEKSFEIVGNLEGRELEGVQYEPVIDCEVQREFSYNERARKVYASIQVMAKKKYKKHVKGKGADVEEEFEQFVTVADGTGLAPCGPGHGQTDNFFAKHYNIPVSSPIDEHGQFTQEVEQWKGQRAKQADKGVVEYLEQRGLLFHYEKITHSYPLCWRCKTPLIFRLSEQIFLSVDKIKASMLHDNSNTRWMPEFGQEAFGNWVAQASDWCVSQQRFWGIPIPLWKCQGCGAKKVVGSVAELQQHAEHNEHNQKVDFANLDDLHRGTVDAIALKCGECSGSMHRVPDIFNVWIDSGISPWASLGYPHKNKELFEKVFPVDLVTEAQDQVRGWFYALEFLAQATFGKPSFKSVSMMGWVVDEKGEKMSKSQGNVVAADQAIAKIGADALRLYYCWDVAPWDTQKFSFTNALEARKALAIWFNALKFYEMYSASDAGLQTQDGIEGLSLEVEDKWILSRLNTVCGQVAQRLETFEFHHAGKTAASFLVEDLSRLYIKLIRDRVGADAPAQTRKAALGVLRHSLLETSRLMSPITPFLSEYLFQRLATHTADKPSAASVHFGHFPTPDGQKINLELEQAMKSAAVITAAASSLRQENKLKLRWPLRRLAVVGDVKLKTAISDLQHLLRAQNNVLDATFLENPPLGGDWREKQVELDGGATASVFIDVGRDEELELLALLRELLRAVQASRKQNGLVVQERISLSLYASGKAADFLAKRQDEIRREVGAAQVIIAASESQLAGEFSAQAELEGIGKIIAKFARK